MAKGISIVNRSKGLGKNSEEDLDTVNLVIYTTGQQN